MAENKVQFNLKNVHYALLDTSSGNPVWETPVAVPGAVSISLSAQGEVTPFYADGIVYYQAIANNGYSGDLVMAMIPPQMLKEVWGFTETTTEKVLVENAFVEPKAFALLFEIDGDATQSHYVMYNCSATRPTIASATTTASKEPQTQTMSVSATPLTSGNIYARTTADTEAQTVTNWYTKVFEPSEA